MYRHERIVFFQRHDRAGHFFRGDARVIFKSERYSPGAFLKFLPEKSYDTLAYFRRRVFIPPKALRVPESIVSRKRYQIDQPSAKAFDYLFELGKPVKMHAAIPAHSGSDAHSYHEL